VKDVKKYFIRFERLKSAPFPLLCFSVFFCFCPLASRLVAQELSDVLDAQSPIGLRLPEVRSLDPRVFPFDKSPARGLSLRGEVSSFLDWQPSSLKRSTSLDSTGKFIIVTEEMNGVPLRQRYMVPLSLYLNERIAYDRDLAWHRSAVENIYRLDADQRRGPGGVNIEIPVPIKSRAFEQIFGGNTVGLNVQGDISIKITGRNENRSEVQTAYNRGSNFSFKMQQQQRFTVTGRIGEKVQVNVDQDSERAFDFENNIRLSYTGFEDDIVQKIEAGNVALSLPGTRFVTFGGTSAGLFGIKTDMQIGNLALTTIASQEKGENKRLTLSGGATEGSQRIQDYDYRRNTYFFLDAKYRNKFRYYRQQKWLHEFDSERTITDIVVYKSAPGYDTRPESIPGRAYPADTLKYNEEIYPGNFIRLEPNVDYYIQNDLGYIVMTNPLGEEEVLGVAFRTRQETVGDVNYIADPDPQKRASINLRLVKAKSPIPTLSTWDLEWKNVYYLGGRSIPREGFELKIFFKPPSGDPQEALTVGNRPTSYLEIFGLDVRNVAGALEPDNVVDFDDVILNLGRGELIFPDLRPFDPDTVFLNGAALPVVLPQDKRSINNKNISIYDTKIRAEIDEASNFYIEIKSKTRSSNYSLGFNIIENSEKVLLNGVELQRDTDYIIDYFSGNLTILKEEASKPNANVEISYQSNSLFQLEKKSILGARAEYRFNPNSYLGGTLLYLSQRTLDQRIRLGSVDNGPMRNLIWDVNAAMKFQPNFLSQALNALPLLSTQESSELRLEGEIAQILPNPNTLNSKVPGDKDGVAYVDDFEASKRSTPLGVIRRGWVQASIPKAILDDPTNVAPPDALPGARKERSALARRGKLIWYNPFSGVATKEIYPDRDVNQTNQITQVLTLEFDPTANEVDKTTPPGLKRAWGGIMRALSPGFFDQTESKFLEIWFYGSRGRVHVDLGQISEDIIPNGQLNTEDIFGGIRNNILDEGEDIGVDGVKGNDGAANFSNDGAGRDYWELTGNTQKNFGEPASDDDWSYTSRSNDYDHINGTENSKNDANEAGGSIRPDTEDINANGGLDLANNYISYTFSIDTNNVAVKNKYFKGGRLSGWKLYRIPLSDGIKSDGTRNLTATDFSRIEYVRVWVDSVDDARGTFLSLADISLVGNEWKEVGIVKTETNFKDAVQDQRFEVTVVNNEENPDEYESPPGVQGEVDRITFLRSKEQSQTLRVKTEGGGLLPNEIAVAQKTFFQPMNLINYNKLKMFVYGKQDLQRAGGAPLQNVEFFIRFGADTSNFYEFREKVFAGWDPKNNMDMDLSQLTSLKADLEAQAVPGYENEYKINQFMAYRFIRINETQELRVRGNPSLTNVRTMVAGIKNLDASKNFWGEIWMDELRVAEVKKDKGIALRVRADLKLADFITLNGEVNRQDADFHNVSQRFGGGDNRTNITLAGSMTFDKLLPRALGLALPISMNYTQTDAQPKYIPGTDILTDSIKTKNPDLFKRSQSFNDQLGFNVSARRRSRSQNFFVKNTLDNITSSLSYTRSSARSSQIDSSRRESWSGDVGYSLNFGAKNYVEPFKWIGKAPLLGKLTNTKLYYTPQNLSTSLQATKNHDFSKTRLAGSRNGVVSNTDVYTAVTNFRGAMKLVENISFDFSHGFTSDLLSRGRAYKDSLDRGGTLPFPVAPKQGLLALLSGDHEVVSLTQSAGVKYSPNLFSWFNPNISYNSNYRYGNNIQQGEIGRSAATNKTVTASSTLRLGELFKFSQRKDAPSGRETPDRNQRQAPRLPPGQRRPDEENPTEEEAPPPSDDEERVTPPDEERQEKSQKEKDDKKKEDKPRRGISPLQLFSVFTKFKDVSVNFSRNDSYSNYALQTGRPSWGYQLGFTRNTGIPQVANVTTTPSTFQRRDNYSASSGFDISRSFNITVRYDHDETRNESTTITGTTSDSWLRSSELGLSFIPNVDIPFPEWSVRWSGLEKFKLFGKFASNLSVEHGFGGKKSLTWNGKPDRKTSEDFAFNFRPLIKVNSTLKNGMVVTFQYSKTSGDRPTYNYDAVLDSVFFQSSAITRTNEMSFTLTYSKQSGFKIPLPFLKNKELRNSVDFSATFLRSTSESGLRRGTADDISANSTKRWSFSPRMTYSFSNRVRGGAHFEIGKTESKLTGTTNIKELGIDINISIRGE
jgi:cell surface protein SprA